MKKNKKLILSLLSLNALLPTTAPADTLATDKYDRMYANIVKNIEAIYKKNKVKCIKLKSSIIKTKIDEFDSIEPICDVILQKVK